MAAADQPGLSEAEACYQAMQLVSQQPGLASLLVDLKNQGLTWTATLQRLRLAAQE